MKYCSCHFKNYDHKQKARTVLPSGLSVNLGGDGGSRTPVQNIRRKISYKLIR